MNDLFILIYFSLCTREEYGIDFQTNEKSKNRKVENGTYKIKTNSFLENTCTTHISTKKKQFLELKKKKRRRSKQAKIQGVF